MQVLKIFLEVFLLGLSVLATAAAIGTDGPGRSLRHRWEDRILAFLVVVIGTALAGGLAFHLFIQALSWITGIPV